jgi:hypothetical protein
MRICIDGARYEPSRRRLRIPSDIYNVKERVTANDTVSDLSEPVLYLGNECVSEFSVARSGFIGGVANPCQIFL